MDDQALLVRQAALQREAEGFVRELGLVELFGRAGRVLQLGSAVTGLMVWRDLDFGVDAPGLTADAAWKTMRRMLPRCSSLRYKNDLEERRHYFVMQLEDWKVDVSLWFAGMPPLVAPFQTELSARLTEESRLAILRLKDVWHRLPHYPEIVSAWEIYATTRQRSRMRSASCAGSSSRFSAVTRTVSTSLRSLNSSVSG